MPQMGMAGYTQLKQHYSFEMNSLRLCFNKDSQVWTVLSKQQQEKKCCKKINKQMKKPSDNISAVTWHMWFVPLLSDTDH